MPEDAPRPEFRENRSCDQERKQLRLRPLSQDLLNPTPHRRPTPLLRPAIRVAWGLWGTFLIGGFFVATRLEPDPSGLGTHQQWGLPPCSVREVFGVPCPSCGMTTSFTHFVRGQFLESAKANAAGLLLAVCCAAQIPWSIQLAITGRYRSVFSVSEILVWVLSSLTLVALAHWGIRLLF